MSRGPRIETLVLVSGLFEDAATVEAALQHLAAGSGVERAALPADHDDAAAWDDILRTIMRARKIVSL